MKKIYKNKKPISAFAFIVLLTIAFHANLYAFQSSQGFGGFNEVGITSPTAAGFAKFGNIPVNLANGVLNISIPLTSISAGSITVPITLNYHASGIKVTEYPGEVGLGWSLNNGGVITRVVRGLPDEVDETHYKGYFSQLSNINSFLTDVNQNGKVDDLQNRTFLLDIAKNKKDADPDIYYYNFLGRAGFFVIDGQGNYVSFPDVNLDIEYSFGNNEIKSFTITDESGKKFNFGSSDDSSIEESKRIVEGAEHPFQGLPGTNPVYTTSHNTAWFLSEISDPIQGQKITFIYESYDSNNQVQYYDPSVAIVIPSSSANNCIAGFSDFHSSSRSEVLAYKRLKEINLLNAGGSQRKVSFIYSIDTNNFPIEYKLNRIDDISASGVINKKIHFNYSSQAMEVGSLLMLESVEEQNANSDIEKTHEFEYYAGTIVNRQSMDRDYLGYPTNDRNTNENLLAGSYGPDRDPDAGIAKRGVIRKINYPTGGYTEFDFESHEDDSGQKYGGLRLKTIKKSKDGTSTNLETISYEYEGGTLARGMGDVVHAGAIFRSSVMDNYNGTPCERKMGFSEPTGMLLGDYATYSTVKEIKNNENFGYRSERFITPKQDPGYEFTFGHYESKYTLTPLPQSSTHNEYDSGENQNVPVTRQRYTHVTKVGTEIVGTGMVSGLVESIPWIQADIQTKYTYDGQGVQTNEELLYRYRKSEYKPVWLQQTKIENVSYDNVIYKPEEEVCDFNYFPPECETIAAHFIMNDTSKTSTEIFYQDNEHRQVTSIKKTNEIGESTTQIFKYAHEVYSAMNTSHQLSQMYSQEVRNSSNTVLSKNWMIWTNNSTISPMGRFRPWKSWVWKKGSTTSAPDTSTANMISEIKKYDIYGNPIEVVDAFGNSTFTYYGSNSQPFQNATLTSNAVNNVLGLYITGIQKQNGTSVDAISGGVRPSSGDDLFVEAEYNSMGQVTSIMDENGETISYGYDKHNRLKELINPNGNIISQYSYYFSKEINSGSFSKAKPNHIQSVSYATDDGFKEPTYSGGMTKWGGDSDYNVTIDGQQAMRVGYDGSGWDGFRRTSYWNNGTAKADIYIHPNVTTGVAHPFYIMSSDGEEIITLRSETATLNGVTSTYFGAREKHNNVWGATVFLINIEHGEWYTVEIEKSTDGTSASLYVYPKELGRDHGGQYHATGFPSNWSTRIQSSGGLNGSGYYIANMYRGETTNEINYLDGLGNQIQTQVRGGTHSLISGTYINDKGQQVAATKPIELELPESPLGEGSPGYINELFGTNFTPGTALPSDSRVKEYYTGLVESNDQDYAYSRSVIDNSSLERVASNRMPGQNGGISTITYGLNTSTVEEFKTSAQDNVPAKTWVKNTLQKTITKDPQGNTVITYTNSLGQKIASGIDMNGDNVLSGDTKLTCTAVDCDLITEFLYDLRGNLVRVEPPLENTTNSYATTYTYDNLGQLIQKQLPDQSHPHTYKYDKKGRLRFHRDPNLEASNDQYYFNRYDELDRIEVIGKRNTSADFNDQNDIDDSSFPYHTYTEYVKYWYDGNNAYTGARNLRGRLTRVDFKDLNSTSSWGYTHYSYNELGLVEWIKQDLPGSNPGTATISYSYNELGVITKLSYEEGVNTFYQWYKYDGAGRLKKVLFNEADHLTTAIVGAEYKYFADGQVKQIKLADGNETVDYKYTIEGWLKEINDESDIGTDEFAVQYDYFNNGNIQTQQWSQPYLTTSSAIYSYSYDDANRLSTAFYGGSGSTGNYDVSYAYDKNGNFSTLDRYQDGNDPNHNFDYTYYTGTNKLKNVQGNSSTGFTYDANGNIKTNVLQGITGATYTWTNQPLSVTANGVSISYDYDHEGNRIKKSISGGATTYYVRGVDGQTMAVYDGSGNLLFYNILAGSQIIGQVGN